MTSSVFIDVESPGDAALLNLHNCSYEIVKKPEDKLCPGYGYFKVIEGQKKLVALFAYEGKLYLYFDRLFELRADDCEVTLKSGLFKNEFKLFKNKDLVLAFKYKPTSYDAGVLEEIYDLMSDKKYSALRVSNTIKILSETDPVLRKEVDQKCVELLAKARKLKVPA